MTPIGSFFRYKSHFKYCVLILMLEISKIGWYGCVKQGKYTLLKLLCTLMKSDSCIKQRSE